MKAVAAMFVFWLAVVGVSLYGWIENIIKLAHMTDIMSGMGIIRCIGIVVAPLGVVMGFI